MSHPDLFYKFVKREGQDVPQKRFLLQMAVSPQAKQPFEQESGCALLFIGKGKRIRSGLRNLGAYPL